MKRFSTLVSLLILCMMGMSAQSGGDASSVTINMTAAIDNDGSFLKTFSSEYQLDFTEVEGIKAYTATKSLDNFGCVQTVVLNPIEVVPAGTGIVLKADAAKAYVIPVSAVADVPSFVNDLLVAETDIDLSTAVTTKWGGFVSGPALLARNQVITGFDMDTFEYTYDDFTGFFPADPELDQLSAGEAYLPIADGEWDSWNDYLPLVFTDQSIASYENIAELVALPVQDAMGIPATLKVAGEVTWTNGDYMTVQDLTGGLLIQVPEGLEVKAGDTVIGSYTGNYVNILFPQLLVSALTDASTLMVLEGTGSIAPATVSIEEAFDDAHVMRVVKLTNLTLRKEKGGYYTDFYVSDENGTEVYVNDAFYTVEDDLDALEDGANIAEMIGFAFIIPDSSPYMSFGVEKYEFVPISLSDTATGINNVASDMKDNAPVYSLQGQRLSTPRKGIYIQNGKKYIR